MEISVVPLGTEGPSVSSYVAAAVSLLKDNKNIEYHLTSMGTIVEAKSVRELLDVAEKMHNVLFDDKIKRVVTTIKIDDRRDKSLKSEGKIDSVKRKIKD